jgi:pSer/pThr/pTyr-binding forkhead associated (FHA) protein
VGRDLDNDIVIRSARISRRHAAFVIGRQDRCQVVDLDSSNGTVVRGSKLEKFKPLRLRSGDMVAFWRFMFQFVEFKALLAMLR